MRRRLPLLATILLTSGAMLAAARNQGAEATSLLGRKLASPALSSESRTRMEADLAKAMAAWNKNRDDVDALIWVGRRSAYLGQFRDAIAFYTQGLKTHP